MFGEDFPDVGKLNFVNISIFSNQEFINLYYGFVSVKLAKDF